jgi:hypothetical protein
MARIINILMMGAPSRVDYDRIIGDLRSVPDVVGVEQLHIWELSAGAAGTLDSPPLPEGVTVQAHQSNHGCVLTCHLLVKKTADPSRALRQALDVCSVYGVQQPTIQVVVVY